MRLLILVLLFMVGCTEVGFQPPDESQPTTSEDTMTRGQQRHPANTRPRVVEAVLDLDESYRVAKKPPVMVGEPQYGAWSNSPLWGGSYIGPIPSEAGKTVPLFEMPAAYGPPAIHTVLITSNVQTIRGSNSAFRGKALIACGAQKKNFQFDWGAGTEFAVVADYIRVTASTYAPNADAAYSSTDNSIEITAAIAKGNSSRGFPLTYTEQGHGFAPTEVVRYPVPDFAKQVYVYVSGNNDPSVATNLHINLLSQAGSIDFDAQIFAGSTEGIPIPGNMTTLTVQNLAAFNQIVQPMWILSL